MHKPRHSRSVSDSVRPQRHTSRHALDFNPLLPKASITTDSACTILTANDTLCRALWYEEHELRQRCLLDFLLFLDGDGLGGLRGSRGPRGVDGLGGVDGNSLNDDKKCPDFSIQCEQEGVLVSGSMVYTLLTRLTSSKETQQQPQSRSGSNGKSTPNSKSFSFGSSRIWT